MTQGYYSISFDLINIAIEFISRNLEDSIEYNDELRINTMNRGKIEKVTNLSSSYCPNELLQIFLFDILPIIRIA
jgi:hypothetical protein